MFAFLFAMYTQLFAIFSQRKEGFPLGGKKTASSLSRKRLMRGDQSALAKGIHSPYAPHPQIVRDSRTFYRPAPPNQPKNFPVRQPPHKERGKSPHTNPAVAVQGSSGRVREIWRVVTDFATQNLVNSGFAALDSPYERGRPAPPRSSSPTSSKTAPERNGRGGRGARGERK